MRKHVARTLATLAVLIGLAAPAQAQLCEGYVSYREGPVQITPGAWFGSGTRQIGVFASTGGDHLYGGAGVGIYTFPHDSGWSVDTQIGYEITLDSRERMFVCPWGAFTYARGSFDDVDADTSGTSAQFGGHFGFVAATSGRVRIVPTAVFGVVMARSTAEGFPTDTDTFPFVGAGVGILLDRRVTIAPRVEFPIGRDASLSGTVFGIHVGLSFGQ